MTVRGWLKRGAVAAAALVLGMVLSIRGASIGAEGLVESAAEEQAGAGAAPLTSARERARTMHSLYAATLEVMHDRYFHGERAMVPARALEDVFAEIARQSQVEARWISVNTKPMSLKHEPQSPFEKRAAKALAAGQEEFELVEDGYYQRAGAIPLHGGCVSCHSGFFSKASESPRFAGLIIRIPLAKE
jgi:hypothetical protein